jgi:predicted nuclease with TOPRIM domain
LNLATDFETKLMADPKKRVFDFVLPSMRSVRIRVSTGQDEERLSKLIKRKDRMDTLSQAILMRLELLEGEKPTLEMVQSLGMRDRSFLRDKFQEVEGGIDTTIELICPACGHEWEKDFDLGTSSFFSLGGRRKR